MFNPGPAPASIYQPLQIGAGSLLLLPQHKVQEVTILGVVGEERQGEKQAQQDQWCEQDKGNIEVPKHELGNNQKQVVIIKTRGNSKPEQELSSECQKEKSSKESLTCTIDKCRASFVSIGELHSHFKSSHPDQQLIRCGPCGKKFKLSNSYKRHMMEKHVAMKKVYCCNMCFFKTNRKCYIPHHLERYHGKKINLEEEIFVKKDNMGHTRSWEQIAVIEQSQFPWHNKIHLVY